MTKNIITIDFLLLNIKILGFLEIFVKNSRFFFQNFSNSGFLQVKWQPCKYLIKNSIKRSLNKLNL